MPELANVLLVARDNKPSVTGGESLHFEEPGIKKDHGGR